MKNNIIFKVLIICILVKLILVIPVMAYEGETHKIINSHIAEEGSAIYGSYLHDYLKNNLGIQDGVKTLLKSKMVKEWISEGGEREDKDLRPLNHFHNPITNRGLTAFDYSALSWATLPTGTQSPESYSWNDVRFYYYNALIYKDKFSREVNYARTFRGIGQVMHLVQDMSVPAHTRNDAHLSFLDFGGDDYELWAKNNIKDQVQINTYSVSFFVPNDYSFLIPNLFDTGQFTGANPDITIQPAIGLAEYTNANFLSRDTIFTDFSHPAYSYMIARIEPDAAVGRDILYLDKTGIGENVDYFARATNFYNYLPENYKLLALTTKDAKVHRSYAFHLMPRAIGYSAQALSYFFRGKLDATVSQNSIKVKNSSNETMTGGRFELYYDNSGDERNLLVISEVAELVSGAEQTFSFTPPQDVKSYMLVYRGTLGNEANAVIGKSIPNGEYIVITVSLVSNPYISGEALTKSVSMVWNPVNNSLERAPVDIDDTGFQEWFTNRNTIGNPMYSGFYHDIYEPHKLAPDLIDTPNMDYHADGSGIFPETIYGSVLIPNSPINYTGIRTSKQTINEVPWSYYQYDYMIWTSADSGMTYGSLPYVVDYDYSSYPKYLLYKKHGRSMTTSDYCFYSPWGNLGLFAGKVTQESVTADVTLSSSTLDEFIPFWAEETNNYQWTDEERYAKSRRWYNSSINGGYTESTVANIYVLQFTKCYYQKNYTNTGNGPATTVNSWTFGNRAINIHAQAVSAPQGTTGYDWVAAGRNDALETQVSAAINMAYELNGVPANEIRNTLISVNIVK